MKTKGFTLWFTGLSGAGKTTLAQSISDKFKEWEISHELLDGDIIRENLSPHLGFTKEDRDTNIKRIGFVAQLLTRHQVPVIVSAISPYRETRRRVREKIGNFVEVFVNCPLEVCEERDVKGLYKQARAGEIDNFTGISDPYEPPEKAEVIVHTDRENVAESTSKIIGTLALLGYVKISYEEVLDSSQIKELSEYLTALDYQMEI